MPNKTFKHRFDTWSEFMEAVTNGKRNPLAANKSQESNHSRWSGTTTFQEALDHLYNGWTEGLQCIRALQRELPTDLFDCVMPVKDYKPELQHKIAGGIIDVPTVLTGATPENFIQEVTPLESSANVVSGRKLITLYYNISNNSGMMEDAFFYRGAYTFLLVEHLENCGYSVEVWAVECCCGHRSTFTDGGDPTNHSRTYIKD